MWGTLRAVLICIDVVLRLIVMQCPSDELV